MLTYSSNMTERLHLIRE